MSESRENLAKELWEHRNDPEEWSQEEEDIEVRPRRSSVLSFRLSSEELDALEEALEQTGESLSEYIRNALALRLHGGATIPVLGTLGITYGAYSGLAESDPNQFLMGHITERVGVVTIEGSGTAASYIPRRSQERPSMRIQAIS